MSDIVTLVDKATSALLLDIDWDTTLQIVDMIRQGDIQPKSAINALLTKLHDANPNVVILALQVLESVVKNCGQVVHEHIATRDFMEEIRDLLKRSTNEDVQKRITLLLAAWVYAFRSEPKYRTVQDTVNILKAEGYKIPTVIESDAMFTADTAPEWVDGECCHRCRSLFTVLRRKHHCRACGQVFCNECSNKYTTIPKFGYEREVRVCSYCYEDITNAARTASKTDPSPATTEKVISKPASTSTTTPSKKTTEEIEEEEQFQLALALSKSEAENKEKEKLRATSNLLGSGWRQHTSTSPKIGSPQIVDKEEEDSELAKYLNRSFWEQKQKQKSPKPSELEGSVRALSPNLPSAPSSIINKGISLKATEVIQNGGMEEVDEFVSTLRSQLEIFVNRMKSNQSRGRPIANDTAVQSLFVNITTMHAQLLIYIQEQDQKRVHCEQLQDKISQIRDARAALDALREEHKDKVRREKEEQERLRQIQMMQKLEIMRKKKQEYLEYQRQLALHRMAESERRILNSQHAPVVPVGQSGFPPMGYPQGYPSQPPLGGFIYPGQSDNQPPNQTMIPPYQGPPQAPLDSTGQSPSMGGFSGPPPPSNAAEYGHFAIPGSPGMTMPAGYGPPVNAPGVTAPQVTQPSDLQMIPPQHQPPPQGVMPQPQPQQQPEEQTQLISFD